MNKREKKIIKEVKSDISNDLNNVYNELHTNFISYINCSKLGKKLNLDYRTVIKYIKILNNLNLFNKPLCEWHNEETEREIDDLIKKSEQLRHLI